MSLEQVALEPSAKKVAPPIRTNRRRERAASLHALDANRFSERLDGRLPLTDRPLVSSKIEKIFHELIDSYCAQDVDALPPILREEVMAHIELLTANRKKFVLHLIGDQESNATIDIKRKITTVFMGLLRSINDAPEKFRNWDTVAFVIAHEIGHVLYEETRKHYGEEESIGDSHDKENYCDRVALTLLTLAGRNVNFARFDAVVGGEGVSIDSYNHGLASSHPNSYNRNEKLKAHVRNHYWPTYAEISTDPFLPEECAEITRPLPVEIVCNSISEAQLTTVERVLLKAYVRLYEERAALCAHALEKVENAQTFVRYDQHHDTYKGGLIWRYFDSERIHAAYQKICETKPKGSEETIFELLQSHIRHTTPTLSEDELADATASGIENRLAAYMTFGHINPQRIEAHSLPSPDSNEHLFSDIQEILDNDSLSTSSQEILFWCFKAMVHRLNGDPLADKDIPKWDIEEICQFYRELPVLSNLRNTSGLDGFPFAILQRNMQSAMGEVLHSSYTYVRDGDHWLESMHRSNIIHREYQKRPYRSSTRATVEAASLIESVRLYLQEGFSFIVDRALLSLSDETIRALCKDPICLHHFLAESKTSWGLLNNQPLTHFVEAETLCVYVEQYSEDWKRFPCSYVCLALRDHILQGTGSISSDRIEALCTQMADNISVKNTAVDTINRLLISSVLAASVQVECSNNALAVSYEQLQSIFNIFPFAIRSDFPAIRSALSSRGHKGSSEVQSFGFDDMPLFRAENLSATLQTFSSPQIEALVNTLSSLDPGVEAPGAKIVLSEFFTRHHVAIPIPKAVGVSYHGDIFDDDTSNSWSRPYDTMRHDRFDAHHETVASCSDHFLLTLTSSGEAAFRVVAADTLMRRWEDSGELTQENVGILAKHCAPARFIFIAPCQEIAPSFQESAGAAMISLHDFVGLKLIQTQGGIAHLKTLSPDEKLEWMRTWWPVSSGARDGVVTSFFQEPFEELSLMQKKEVISLFDSTSRAALFREKMYEIHKDQFETLEGRLTFLFDIFPDPSPSRDEMIDGVFVSFRFFLHQFHQVIPHLSFYSTTYHRQDSYIEGSFGAVLTWASADDKRDILIWLCGRGEKPQCIHNAEKEIGAHFDEVPQLMTHRSFRREVLSELLASNHGLFSEHHWSQLEEALDTIVLKPISEVWKERSDGTRLEPIIAAGFKAIFQLDNHPRKLAVTNALFDQVYDGEPLTPETLVMAVLLGFEKAGIKSGQVIEGQHAIRVTWPQLIEKLVHVKDNIAQVPPSEGMMPLLSHRAVRVEDPIILGPLASASIKGVFDILVSGEPHVAKSRRATANKDLDTDRDDLRAIAQAIAPIVGGIALEPYVERVVELCALEIDFKQDRQNQRELGAVVRRISNEDLQAQTVEIRDHLCSDNLTIERKAPGVSLGAYLQTASAFRQRRSLADLQKIVLLAYHEGKVLPGDLHDRNVFRDRSQFSLLDVMPLLDMSNPVLATVFESLACASVPPLNQPQTYRKLLREIVPETFRDETMLEKVATHLPTVAPFERALIIVNTLDNIDGFHYPSSLYHLLYGASKMPYLFSFYPENTLTYIKVFGSRYLDSL